MESDSYERWVQRQIDSGDKPAIHLFSFTDKEPDSFIVTWYWRSLRVIHGLDAGDRFIALWISFNAILVQRYEQSLRAKRKAEKSRREPWISESELLKEFYRDRYWSGILDEISDSEFRKFVSDLKSLCPVIRSKTREKVSITEGRVEDIFNVVYAVRNNLFHGAKDPSDVNSRDYKLVMYSFAILLSFLTRHLLKENLLRSGRAFLIGELLHGYDILV